MGLSAAHMAPVPSLAIGSCEAIPLALFSAYSAFPAGGVRTEPFCIDTIYDRTMSVLISHHPVRHNALNSRTAYMMTSMLRSVVLAGTAFNAYLRGITWPVAGKTGTTNEYTDAWFVGFTALQTCGLWTGIDEKRSLGPGRTGAGAALPLWTDFMLWLHDSCKVPAPEFAMPGGITTKKVCKVSYLLAGDRCDSTYDEVFVIGTEPEVCTQNHEVKREFRENKMDPFGTRNNNRAPPQDSAAGPKKKKSIYLM
jgi:penicillin-binding protein 1A